MLRGHLPVLAVAMSLLSLTHAQEDVADVPSQERKADGDARKRYFLVGPTKAERPRPGYGLVVILPGGDGSEEFHPFVKRIYKHALGDGWIVAQPVAVKWTEDQRIVWPTERNRVPKMAFSTEVLIETVVRDVLTKHRLNPARIFTLSWSSSGPAAYAVSLRKKTPVVGSFVAMSVFKPQTLPALDAAKGQAYFLYHSRDDRVCPFRFADKASSDLESKGAAVTLRTYEGGHGWPRTVYADIRAGVQWLADTVETARKKRTR